MAKISIGSWAYCFGPYEDDPIPLETVAKRLNELNFDGIELCGFRPHVHPDDYATKESRDGVKALLAENGLGISGIAADFMEVPPGTPAAVEGDAYIKCFEKNIQLCLDIGIPSIRVDTVSEPPVPEGVDRDVAWKQTVALWQKCAQIAQDAGTKLVWEFEPGFAFNKPSEIVKMVEDVGHPNFSVLFDTCHAHMVAVVAARQAEPKETLEGGAIELAGMLKGKIGHVHLIDSDETLHGDMTSTHAPFGQGILDFGKLIPAILDAGYDSEWWPIDLCFWPEAWEVTEAAKKFLDPLLQKHVG